MSVNTGFDSKRLLDLMRQFCLVSASRRGPSAILPTATGQCVISARSVYQLIQKPTPNRRDYPFSNSASDYLTISLPEQRLPQRRLCGRDNTRHWYGL